MHVEPIILKWNLKTQDARVWTRLQWRGSCVHGNEPSDSIKLGTFLRVTSFSRRIVAHGASFTHWNPEERDRNVHKVVPHNDSRGGTRFVLIRRCVLSVLRGSRATLCTSQNAAEAGAVGRVLRAVPLKSWHLEGLSAPLQHCMVAQAVRRRPRSAMWDLWWTKWHWCRFSPSTSVSPPLWSSGQGSCLQIQRSGFDSRLYQIF
jgi:hypothetical protein